jgi:hypothetical protein
MLSFVEEILLLMLDDSKGQLVDMPLSAFNTVISGAALMDLAIRDRIDTDLQGLFVTDAAPLGDDILDDALACVVAAGGRLPVAEWVDRIALRAADYKERALQRLVARRILKEENGRFLWFFHVRRYPMIDDREEREVKARLRQLLLTDEIPEPRDVVLICLVDACVLFDLVLSTQEQIAVEARIEQLRKLDLIGQAVAKAVWDIQASIAVAASTTI